MQIHLVPVEIRIVRIANAFVKPERSVPMDLRPVRHYGQFVQTWLAVEQHDVPVVQMSLHKIPELYEKCGMENLRAF